MGLLTLHLLKSTKVLQVAFPQALISLVQATFKTNSQTNNLNNLVKINKCSRIILNRIHNTKICKQELHPSVPVECQTIIPKLTARNCHQWTMYLSLTTDSMETNNNNRVWTNKNFKIIKIRTIRQKKLTFWIWMTLIAMTMEHNRLMWCSINMETINNRIIMEMYNKISNNIINKTINSKTKIMVCRHKTIALIKSVST